MPPDSPLCVAKKSCLYNGGWWDSSPVAGAAPDTLASYGYCDGYPLDAAADAPAADAGTDASADALQIDGSTVGDATTD